MNLKELEKQIKKNPSLIRDLDSQPESLCLMALKKDWRTLEWIKEPTEEMITFAIHQNPEAIQFVKNPTEEQMRIAVIKKGLCLKYLEQPSEVVQLAAIRSGGLKVFAMIENPSYDFCQQVVQIDGKLLKKVPKDYRTPELCELAVRQDGESLVSVPKKLRTESLCLTAVKQCWTAVKFVPHLTQEMIELAIHQDRSTLALLKDILSPEEMEPLFQQFLLLYEDTLAHVPHQTVELCETVVEKFPRAARFVKYDCFSEKILRIAIRNGVYFFTTSEARDLLTPSLCLEHSKSSFGFVTEEMAFEEEYFISLLMNHFSLPEIKHTVSESVTTLMIKTENHLNPTTRFNPFMETITKYEHQKLTDEQQELIQTIDLVQLEDQTDLMGSADEILFRKPLLLKYISVEDRSSQRCRMTVALDEKAKLFSPYHEISGDELKTIKRKLM